MSEPIIVNIMEFLVVSGGFKVELKTTILPSKDYQSMESVTKLSRDCPKCEYI